MIVFWRGVYVNAAMAVFLALFRDIFTDSTTSVTEMVQSLRMALSWRGVYPNATMEVPSWRGRLAKLPAMTDISLKRIEFQSLATVLLTWQPCTTTCLQPWRVGYVVNPAHTRKSEPNSFKLERPNGDKDSSNGDTQDSFDIELNFPVVPISDYNDIKASSISEILNGVSVVDVKKNGSDDIFLRIKIALKLTYLE
ncbi:hypothetical protein Tco_0451634 [Tanacetum coccineum]